MTTLHVQLSPDTNPSYGDGMQSILQQAGVNAYVVWFDQTTTTPQWVPLVNAGILVDNGSVAVNVDGITSGKFYILVENGATDLTTVINSEADISAQSALTNNYRFDSFELTTTGVASANLTDAVGFGLPMGVRVVNGTTQIASAGYNITANTLIPNLGGTVTRFSSGPLSTVNNGLENLWIVQNAASNPPSPAYSPSDWNDYLSAIAQQTDPIQVSGVFNPGTGSDAFNIAHSYALYNYNVTYDALGHGEDPSDQGVFIFTPNANSQVKGTIVISKSQLANSIYATNGFAQIYQSYDANNHLGVDLYTPDIVFNSSVPNTPSTAIPWPSSGGTVPQPGQTADGFVPQTYTDSTTGIIYYAGQFSIANNNQWGEIFTGFLTSLNSGLIGAVGVSPNPLVTSPINLSQQQNQSPQYYFRPNQAQSNGNGYVSNSSPGYQISNAYAQQFYQNTNSYGFEYSDQLSSALSTGSPLLYLGNASDIYLTIYGDAQNMQTVAQNNPNGNYGGYVSQTFQNGNYIDPSKVYTATDQPATASFVTPISVSPTVSFNIQTMLPPGANNGSSALKLDERYSILKFNIMDGAGGVAQTLTLNGAGAGSFGLWQNWNITSQGGTFSIAPQNTTSGAEGELIINGLPLFGSTQNTDNVFWYQLEVDHYTSPVTSSGGSVLDSSKSFNIYTVATSSGAIDTQAKYGANAQSAVSLAGAGGVVQIDGGASITTAPTTTNAQINLFDGLNASWLTPYAATGPNIIYGTPTAPVAGTLTNGVFSPIITNTQNTKTYQTSDTSPQLSMKATGATTPIAFSWTGANHNATNTTNAILGDPSGWASVWSNKALAGDIIKVTVSQGGQTVTTTNTTADLDGEWTTQYMNLAPGSYSVTSQEYDASGTIVYGQQSSALTLDITSADAPLYYTPDTASGRLDSELYSGPVNYLDYQYVGAINGNTMNDVLGASIYNDFINLSAGDDAVNGYAGADVLDGGSGSNFLTGGGGHDVFFIDGRATESPTWSTITDFIRVGDNANTVDIWGWQQGISSIIGSSNTEGVGVYTGATYHFDLNGDHQIDTSITFSGWTTQDLGGGIAKISSDGTGYLFFG